ncbi:MAG: hypothetical protein COU71_01805 [Parcubacteria group bacterium CG10_big_fil_rev_8_21_14_0_10_38_31]|nr:MAG: hypothetical protein COU71_01805 [Parcubacteria group bacterium CG10_big_fil_rev_8_21_14_0_10_38_31]
MTAKKMKGVGQRDITKVSGIVMGIILVAILGWGIWSMVDMTLHMNGLALQQFEKSQQAIAQTQEEFGFLKK